MFVIYIAYTAHHHIRSGLPLLRVQRLQRVRLNPIVAVQVKHELPGGVASSPVRRASTSATYSPLRLKNSSKLIIPCPPSVPCPNRPGGLRDPVKRRRLPFALTREMSGFTEQVQGLPRVSSFILRRVRRIRQLHPAGKRLAGFYEKRVWRGVCL